MWPEDAFSLPARDGYDVGGAQERAMSARVDGYGGIRETYEVNPDGSVTTLRTRLGWPAFETTGQPTAAAAPTVPERGFVAKVPGGRAVLFNPYTLAVLKSPYLPASNSYSVQDFGTTWNVAPSDTTHWYDVVLFDGTTIKVNSKAMPALRITADHGFPAIPYVINRGTSDDQYGNSERNATEKRVFAVGRFSVKSWGGGGLVETLTPTEPRTDSKAMTLGQRTDRATSTAWLAQMFYSGYTWYDEGGEWGFSTAQVQMILAASYLIKTSSGDSAALPIATFGSPVNTTPNTTQAITLPSTPVGITGPGEIQQNDPYLTFGLIRGGFRTNSTIWHEYPGRIEATNNKTQYTGTSADTRTISGYDLTYSGSNSKIFLTANEQTYCDGGVRPLAPADAYGPATDYLKYTGTTLYWNSGYNASTVPTYRGSVNKTVYDFPINGSSCTRYYENQTGDFQVSCNAVDVVRVTFSKDKQYGPKALLSPNTTYYDQYMGTLWIGGFGMGASAEGYYYAGSDVSGYKTTYPNPQPPEAIAEINAALQEMGQAWYGQIFVTDETRSGTYRTNYWYASTPNYALTTGTLSWSTVDYLLHDATNGVFITVEASFSGVDALATLTVLLRVKTRHHSNTQTLGVFSYNYGSADGMLHEVEIGVGTSKYAVPSPQIRAIFAPLYQEQGSFKGAHYVTLAEESNGATPFHGFNFLLYLRPYSDFDTCNKDNDTGQAIYFVPCNLLEMLYAFVFSSEYGVAEDGTRYPVTHSANFTALMNTLFSNPIRVAVKDGVAGAWTDALGSDFASVSTVSLHRA